MGMVKMKKIIFLDFDGVLNTYEFLDKLPKPKFSDYQGWKNHDETFKPENIENLNHIIEKTGASIVISSSWRRLYTLKQIKNVLKKNGFKYIESVIDFTPSFEAFWNAEYSRGAEIYRWLADNDLYKKCNFVILDDNSDMSFLIDKLIKTDPHKNGLTREDSERAILLLTSKEKEQNEK